MPHVFRAAVAAISLFTVPACVTTGSPGSNAPGAIETATNPAADEPAGATSGLRAHAGNPASLGGTATLLAWAQSQTGVGGAPHGAQSLVFEQPDSRLRLVLNMLDRRFAGEAGGASSGARAAAEPSGATVSPEVATFWLAAPTTLSAGVFGLDRVTLGGPVGESVGELLARQPAEVRNTPEPGTLALVAVGLGVVGWRFRNRTATPNGGRAARVACSPRIR